MPEPKSKSKSKSGPKSKPKSGPKSGPKSELEPKALSDAGCARQSEPKAPALYGPDLIADYVSRLPYKPGVYRMFDETGAVLYVGKAKSLKKRVSAYTRFARHPIRIQRMIRATHAMEFVITGSETEALLLEASLIKRLKPRYNILLRDDKSFPYILVRKNHPAAQIANPVCSIRSSAAQPLVRAKFQFRITTN